LKEEGGKKEIQDARKMGPEGLKATRIEDYMIIIRAGQSATD
jgi:hypothetical protein